MTGGGRRGPRARAGVLRRFLPRALAWPLLLGAVVCATALSPAQAQAKDKDRLIVGMQLAGDQFHQGGFAFAVTTDDAHALVQFDREIDVFEQEGAADTEVDALKLDQGHLRILGDGAMRSVRSRGEVRLRILQMRDFPPILVTLASCSS